MAYRTVASEGRAMERIENSRFIAIATEVDGASAAQSLLDRMRAEFPDATHHCWAYRCQGEMRFSDDGEPGGTAGRPILEVVLKRELDRVAIVVVRYFGGRRLGSGGLVRAYGGTAARALDAAGVRTVEDAVQLTLHIPYALIDQARRIVGETRGVAMESEEYDSGGWLVRVALPTAEEEGLTRRLADISRGAIRPERTTLRP